MTRNAASPGDLGRSERNPACLLRNVSTLYRFILDPPDAGFVQFACGRTLIENIQFCG